jgi:DNA-binding transcriptional LysR family regulator
MKLSSIDLNLLVVFDAIAQTGSVSLAADRVGISKAAMSHALARLRAQAGDPVLVRSGQDWVLTDAARALTSRVHTIVEEARAVLAPQGPETDKLQRDFRILTTDLVLSLLGNALGHDTARDAPGVNLCFLPLMPDDVPSARLGADLAIGVFSNLGSAFRTQRLFQDRFVSLARRSAVGRKELTLDRFLAMRHVQVAPRGRPGGSVDDALAALGLTRRVARSVPYFLAALDLVANSDCIVTASARLAHLHAGRFGLSVFEPPLDLPHYDISQVWHPEVDSDSGHRWLRRAVSRAAKELPGLDHLDD